MTPRGPRRRVAHYTVPGYRAGNSYRGRRSARADGFRWIDQDAQITADGIVVNTHWPRLSRDRFLPKRDRRRVHELGSQVVLSLRSTDGYRIWTMATALRQAAKMGLFVELEAKGDRRFQQVETWEKLADAARAAYGPYWQERVEVKTLTRGGVPEALARLKAAKQAGFTTIILPRGRARLRKNWPAYVDWVRR